MSARSWAWAAVPVAAAVSVGAVGVSSSALIRALGRIGGLERQAKVRVFHELASDAPRGAIVFAGDSITEGYRTAEYFAPIAERTGAPILNRGISGETSADLLARWEDVVVLRPSQLVLLIGTNDLGQGGDPRAAVANVDAMLARLGEASPGTRVHLLAVFPVNTGLLGGLAGRSIRARRKEGGMAALNAGLAEVAARRGAEWVDLTELLAGPDGALDPACTYDGLHLSATGYRRVTEALAPRLLSAPPRSAETSDEIGSSW